MAAKKPSKKLAKHKAAPVSPAIMLAPSEIEALREDRRAAEAYLTARWGKVKTTSELLKEMAKARKP